LKVGVRFPVATRYPFVTIQRRIETMSIKLPRLALLGLAAVVTLGPVAAQVPDCTGISTAHNTHGDLDGELTAVLVATGLELPVFVTSPPGDVERLFIVEQDGVIKILRDGAVLGTAFLDISAITRSPADGGHQEEGLLGLAFHPNYDVNGWFFVYHTNEDGSDNVVARYTVSGNPDVADPTSRTEVIAIEHLLYDDQNGGMLAFSPLDGHLYVGSGDGGGDCDPSGNGQSLSTNLGKLLRLGVDSLPPSTAGNPFDGPTTGNDEIWAYGLRNPWRFSFDRLTGNLLIGDVGEGIHEEIDCQVPASTGGENYGWSSFEGDECPPPSPTCVGSPSCLVPSYEEPIRVYDHVDAACAVVGGYVYRGCRMPDLHGTYFYADYCTSFHRTFRVDETCTITSGNDDLDRTADLYPGGGVFFATSFGEDERGELYVTYIFPVGAVYKIVPVLGIMEVSGPNAPALLAAANGDWVWEDLEQTSGHPISSYKVYRSDDDPAGTFFCVHEGAGDSWSGGDPASPGVGEAFYYVVTALNGSGEESHPGVHTDGTPRDVDFASACP
jgi:glucose/arabinose dehydrogenase